MVKRKVKKAMKKLVAPKYAKLNSFKFGFAGGIVCGILIALITLLGIFGMFPTNNLVILDLYGFLAYSTSWLGVLLGAIYAFVDGFVISWFFAIVYNKLI